MPTISYFFGILVKMNYVDHNPPHFHAEYQGLSASFLIETGELLAGRLPKTLIPTIRKWALTHRTELEQNWENARLRKPLFRIQGADND